MTICDSCLAVPRSFCLRRQTPHTFTGISLYTDRVSCWTLCSHRPYTEVDANTFYEETNHTDAFCFKFIVINLLWHKHFFSFPAGGNCQICSILGRRSIWSYDLSQTFFEDPLKGATTDIHIYISYTQRAKILKEKNIPSVLKMGVRIAIKLKMTLVGLSCFNKRKHKNLSNFSAFIVSKILYTDHFNNGMI